MQDVQLGGLLTHITGGTDREGGGDGPLVVLLHGFGAPGTDLVGLWRAMRVPSNTRFAFPEAPIEMPEFGYPARAWWHIDMARFQRPLTAEILQQRMRDVPEGMAFARERVVACLDALQAKLGVSSERIVLGGFSQGAMLACEVALSDPRRFAGLVLLSTTLINAENWLPRLSTLAQLPVFQSHGQNDPILPFAIAEQLRNKWTEAGAQHTWVPFRGAHEIPGPVLEGLSAFVTRVVE